MDWQSIAQGLLAVIIGGSLIGLAWWFKVGRMIEGRGAEKFANDWHQQVIKRQDEEAVRLRSEIQTLRDQRRQDQDIWRERMETLRREYTDFRNQTTREFGHVQKFNRDTQSDIRKLARAGNVQEEQLDTQIYRTGQGPLDP